MKYEHILNMEYSLRDALYLFWLVKEKGMSLPLVYYQCDYKLLDTHNYFMAINDPSLAEQHKKMLQKHLKMIRFIFEMAQGFEVGASNIALFANLAKSSHIYSFECLRIENKEQKGKSIPQYQHSIYKMVLDEETSKPRWELAGELHYTAKDWFKKWDKDVNEFMDKYEKMPYLNRTTALDMLNSMRTVKEALEFLLDIKAEHPHRNIIDSLIPKHVKERYREELEYIFSNGKYNKEQVEWMTGYNGLQENLRSHYDNGTIPHHYQNWCDFAMNNFTQKNGRVLNKKSLQNASTRQNWENHSRNSSNHLPNPSQTVPETFPNISLKVQVKATIN